MAGICTSCGSALEADARRCLQCGAPVSSPPGSGPGETAGVQTTAAVPALPPVKRGKAVLRIILGLLAFCTLLAIFSIGSCVYFDYRLHKSGVAVRPASHYAPAQGAHPTGEVEGRDVCSLVTNNEVGEALGATVSSTHTGPTTCRYTSSDNRSMVITVSWQGAVMALRFSAMAMKVKAGKAGIVRQVMGLGDEAYVGHLGSTLMFRKGDVMVALDVSTIGGNFRPAVAIARKILTRIQ